MFEFGKLSDKWALLSVLTGLALMIIFVLSYMDIWRPRKMKSKNPEDSATNWLPMWKSIPWSLKIIYIFLVIWSFVYGVYLILNPPNW